MRWKRGRRSSNIEDRRGARLRTGLPNLFPGRRGGTAARRPRGRGGLVVTVLVLLGLYFLGVDPRLLLQIFSETLIGPVFFEFIQRKKDEGFGEGNFQALFESMERDQLRRGVDLG